MRSVFDEANKHNPKRKILLIELIKIQLRSVIYIAYSLTKALQGALNSTANKANKHNTDWCRMYR
jgi:hypothetical protein